MTNIDFHVHITPPDITANWRKYAEKEPWFSLLSESPQNRFACAEDIVAALSAPRVENSPQVQEKSLKFDKAVVFGFGFRDIGLCRYVNDYVIEKTRQYPDKLIGFISVPPGSADACKEIGRCYGAGLKGVGELFPTGQGFNPGEPKETAAMTGACKELGLPVLIHSSEPVGRNYPGKDNCSLRQFEKFIENNPDIDIVLAHWGGGLFFYEAMPELRKKLRNVYYDTAAAPFLYDARIYRAAKALDLTEKILFGSDFPLLPHSRYLAALDESGFSEEEKNLVLGGNAERLLGFR